MKHSVAFCILLLASVFSIPGAGHAETVDQVMASVGTEPILLSEVMAEIAPQIRDLRARARNEAEFTQAADELVGAALEQAIENKILLREAMLAGIEIDEDTVNKRLQEVRALYPSSEEFMKDLQQAGETMGDLRERLRKQLMARSMAVRKRRQFEREITVTESEVAQYYQDNRRDFDRPERARVRQIFIESEDGADARAVARARIDELKKELDAGADFQALAKAHSQAPGADEGGIIGWVVRGDLVAVLEQAVFSLPEGGVSGVLESPGGFHILQIEQREEAGQATLDEVRREIQPILRDRAAGERYRKWMAELRKQSRVKVLF